MSQLVHHWLKAVTGPKRARKRIRRREVQHGMAIASLTCPVQGCFEHRGTGSDSARFGQDGRIPDVARLLRHQHRRPEWPLNPEDPSGLSGNHANENRLVFVRQCPPEVRAHRFLCLPFEVRIQDGRRCVIGTARAGNGVHGIQVSGRRLSHVSRRSAGHRRGVTDGEGSPAAEAKTVPRLVDGPRPSIRARSCRIRGADHRDELVW